MVRLQKVLCAISLLGVSVGCFAGSDSGIYVGGSIGSTSTSFAYDMENDFDSDDTGYKIFAGYNFGLLPLIDIAVEGSYINFGEASGDLADVSLTSETTAWDVFGLAGFNMGPVGVFGKLGLVAWDSETLVKGVSDIEDGKDDGSGSDLAYGIGAKMQLMSISVRAEYEVFDIENVDTDMISIGAAFTF